MREEVGRGDTTQCPASVPILNYKTKEICHYANLVQGGLSFWGLANPILLHYAYMITMDEFKLFTFLFITKKCLKNVENSRISKATVPCQVLSDV